MAVAYSYQEVTTEELPADHSNLNSNELTAGDYIKTKGFSDCKIYCNIEEKIFRKPGEDWIDYVSRTKSEAQSKKLALIKRLKNDSNIVLPHGSQLLCRLTWNSEKEWQVNFGLNLITLHSGDFDHPEYGIDSHGVHYIFKYPDETQHEGRYADGTTYNTKQYSAPDRKSGRRIFNMAEQISDNFDEINSDVCSFLKSEWDKVSEHKSIMPGIISFTLKYCNNWHDIFVMATLNETNPDNEPIYDYWKVELKNLNPIRLL